MNRESLIPYVAMVLDDTGNVQEPDHLSPNATLVAWQCGFEPYVIAVQSYLPNIRIDAGDAEEIATDYLRELGWFTCDAAGYPDVAHADYVIEPAKLVDEYREEFIAASIAHLGIYHGV